MIVESIVTTENREGAVHIAPFGLTVDGDELVIAPFRPSVTLENLKSTGVAVVNFTDDVRVFAGCLTGRRNWPTRPATKIKGQILDGALSHLELEVASHDDDPQRPRFRMRAVHREIHGPFGGFNRAQAAVIEAAILVSRLDRLPAEKIDREIEYLSIAIGKTAGPRELEAWGWLMDHIAAARKSGATAAR